MNVSAKPLRRPSFYLFACLLVILLAGCNPDESDKQSAVSLDSASEQTQAPVAVPESNAGAQKLLPVPSKQTVQPVSGSTVKLIIEVSRATASVDLDALQSGSELPAPPLQLTVDLYQAPLRTVLRELARKLDAKISIADDVPDQPISLQLNEVDLAEGIKQLLRNTDYLLIYKDSPAPGNAERSRDNLSATAIAEIRVLPKNSAGKIAGETAALKTLEPADQAAEVEEWKKQALTAEQPEDRLAALKRFLELAEPAEHNAVLVAALEDEAPEIRKLALSSMADSANPLQEAISQTALNDEDPRIRTAALDVLVSRYGENATPVLEQALNDPDVNVQKTARNSLEMSQRVKSQVDALLHRQPK